MALTRSIDEIVDSDSTGLLGVHASWQRVQLGDVADVVSGYPFPSRFFSQGEGMPLIRIRNILRSATDTTFLGAFDSDWLVSPGDLLVGMDGDFNSSIWQGPVGLLNQRVARVRVNNDFYSSRLLAYLLPAYLRAINEYTSSVTVKHLSLKTLKSIPLPLPGRDTQERLAAKLDEVIGGLRVARGELVEAQANLLKMRESYLSAAMTGELSREWRSGLAPVSGTTSGQSSLPFGWVRTTLGEMGQLERGRSSHRPRNAPHLFGGPYPFIQTGDVRAADTFVDHSEVTYSEAGLAQSKMWPAGTLCITIAAHIGETAILGIDACFPDSVVAFTPKDDQVSVEFLEYAMRAQQRQLEAEAPATAQRNINLKVLNSVEIALPPIREQLHVVEVLQGAFADLKVQSEAIVAGIDMIDLQIANVLRSAVSGDLVSGVDPNEAARDLKAVVLSRNLALSKQTRQRVRKPTKGTILQPLGVHQVLVDAKGEWVDSQDLFQRCGIGDGSSTEQIEAVYEALRELDQAGLLDVQVKRDQDGNKTGDALRVVGLE